MTHTMRDSGIAWMGQIPQHWTTGMVRQHFIRKNEKAEQENPVVLSLARSGVKVRDISTNEGQLAASYFNYNPVAPGDLLLNPMDLYSGANCSISRVRGVISPAYVNLKHDKDTSPVYFDYYFKLQYWSMAFFAHGKGVSHDNRWTLSNETLMHYPIIIPPFTEQQAIAHYLDDKCGVIDTAIAKQHEIIERLGEYKNAIISEKVCRGLDADVQMKDSGVDWIGKIPCHWSVKKIKNCFEFEKGKNASLYTQEYIGAHSGGYPVYSGQTENDGIMGTIDTYDYDLPECVFTTTVGAKAMTPKYLRGRFSLSQNCLIMLQRGEYKCKMLFYALHPLFAYEKSLIPSYMQPSLRIADLRKYFIPSLPLPEQQAIVQELDKICAYVDAVIAKRERLIELLTEYKRSLIYEYVTGKKDVVDTDFK